MIVVYASRREKVDSWWSQVIFVKVDDVVT